MLWHYRTDVRDLGDLLADRDPDQEISRLSLCERDRGTEPPLLSSRSISHARIFFGPSGVSEFWHGDVGDDVDDGDVDGPWPKWI